MTVTFYREHEDNREPQYVEIEVETDNPELALEQAEAIMIQRGYDLEQFLDQDIR